jgi:signal peptide peptidase SppA
MMRFLPFVKSPPRVSVLRLSGMIAAGRGLNDEAYGPVIEKAFAKGKPTAVALVINSPGGSPVQSSLIAGRIRRLADEKDIPVHAFVDDVAASGGYWLATAADHIWVDASSVLGSIGVISAGFGFHQLLSEYGVERRVHTAGESKSFMDPFLPEKEADVARLKTMLTPIHDNFIAQVKARRGDRLTKEEPLFGGEVFVGQRSIDVGLADGLGVLAPKMKELYGDKTKFTHFAPRKNPLARFGLSAAVSSGLDEAQERAMYARFGL